MRITTIVEQDDRTLLEIINALDQFEKDRFLAGLQARHYTKYDIEQALEMVGIYQHRMNMEAHALRRFSEDFIRQFATDNNKCFEAAERLFNRIRSTLCALKKVFRKTTPRSMAQLPEEVAQPTVWERSALSYGPCVADIFGLASYDDDVNALYQQLDVLLTTATSTLTLCHEMIEKEVMVREDKAQLKLIYDESCSQLMSSVREYAEFMGVREELPEAEMDRRRQKAHSLDDFLRKEYHVATKREFKRFVWLEAVRQGRSEGLTEEETYLWRDDSQRVEQIRWAIKHFDEMDVEGQEGKLDSTSMVYFLRWCDVEQTKEKRLYKYFCDTYKGRYQLLAWSSVSKERKDQKERGITPLGQRQAFQRMIDAVRTENVAV